MDQKKYLKMFVREAGENLEALNNSLMKIEKKPDDIKSATELMRAAHTLKSSAAAMGYARMSQLAHAIEDIFDGVRSGKSRFSSSNSNVLFAAFDLIDKSLQEVKTGRSELDTAAVIEKLQTLKNAEVENRGKNAEINAEDPASFREGEAEGVALAEKPEILRPLEDIKVGIETLDSLMNLSEELLVNKMRLSEILAKEKYEEFPVAIDMLGRLVSDMQYNVMQARMVPLNQIFDRFPRMIRDLADKEKKNVNLEIEGGEIELDRTVIDKIGEPLVHLLRNAVDHGIPSLSADRESKGKVQLRAGREKGYVAIEVINDGNSIDWEAVIEAAVRKGIISRAKGEELSRKYAEINTEKREEIQYDSALLRDELEKLIYHPELSTSQNITETSGRGIGLNIVKTRIESLGGTVSVESPIKTIKQKNNKIPMPALQDRDPDSHVGTIKQEDSRDEGGTRFILRIPLTIAVIQALLVKVAEEIYAIPIADVDRSVKVRADLIKKAFDREVITVDNVSVPLIRLDRLFNAETKNKGNNEASVLAVIIKKSVLPDTDKKEEKPVFGLAVDTLVSEQDIIIKPLIGILKQNKGFAGITILGDGRPALILDVATLM